MFGLGFTEILVILCVALIVLGPDKLPETARSLGRFVGMFRRTLDEVRHELSAPSFTQNDIKKALEDITKPDKTIPAATTEEKDIKKNE